MTNKESITNDNLCELDNVTFSFGKRVILEDINLAIKVGEKISVVGPNGGGKTSLLKLVLGLVKPSKGTVEQKAKIAVGYQPQHTIVDPSIPLSARSLLELSPNKNEQQKMFDEIIDLLDIQKKTLDAQLSQLSGGERQLVMIARAMLCAPDLLALDEPGTYCDQRHISALYAAIDSFSEKHHCATICISHDINKVLLHSDHILCVDKKILCEGGATDILRDDEFEKMFGEPGQAGVYLHHDHPH